MGTTSTSRADLNARAQYRAATNTVFAYDTAMRSTPAHLRSIHESVDPRRKNTVGKQVRECLDSAAHPATLPVAVVFDQTGSMGDVPRILQQKLGTLYGALLRMGLTDAQLCFGAYGDAHNDETAPLQVGQFESGIEMTDWLNNLFLEGNGGGNGGETSGLALYFLAAYAELDSLKKRGKKGYLILTGDECPHKRVSREEIKRYVGVDVEADLTIEEAVKMAQAKFNVYFFLINNSTAYHQNSLQTWQQLLGKDNVLVVENPDTISEQIAMLVATEEAAVDTIADAGRMLLAEGADPRAVNEASLVLARRTPRGGGSIAKASGGTLTAPANRNRIART